MIKILNLYSCIGGNRYKWDEVAKEIGVEIEVTAIELDQELAFLYQERFPNDKVIVADYEPLIPAQKRHRHLYWTNLNLPNVLSERTFEGFSKTDNEVKKLCEFHDYDFYKYKGTQRRDKVARNLVDYEAGKTIFKCFLGMEIKKEQEQTTLF